MVSYQVVLIMIQVTVVCKLSWYILNYQYKLDSTEKNDHKLLCRIVEIKQCKRRLVEMDKNTFFGMIADVKG